MDRVEELARSAKYQVARRKSSKSIGKRDPSLRWPHLYDILRAKGHDKEAAARISNSRVHLRKNGRLRGLPYKQADNPKALKKLLASSSLVAACHSAACAPPPNGTGGSLPSGGGSDAAPVNVDYRGYHQPNEDGPRGHDLTEGGIAPSNVYTHPQYYTGFFGSEVRETMQQLKRVKGNPNAELTIYRAVPKGVTEINDGDWVTLSRSYATLHGLGQFDEGASTVLTQRVKASEVRWAMDDLTEFGYFPNLRDVPPEDL